VKKYAELGWFAEGRATAPKGESVPTCLLYCGLAHAMGKVCEGCAGGLLCATTSVDSKWDFGFGKVLLGKPHLQCRMMILTAFARIMSFSVS